MNSSRLTMTNLYVWRNVCRMYLPLESFLSTQEICDEALICIDPDFPDDAELASRLSDKFDKVRIINFRWPTNVPGDGTRIGIASRYALSNARGDYCLNVQADEIYSPYLMEWIRDNWKDLVMQGLECLRIKVLNLEHNAQQYQGGNEGSTWDWQCGAGYNCSIKMFKRCPAINFERDGWSMSGCSMLAHAEISETYPIMHLHDHFRDTLIELRKTAATEIWTDRDKFGHYWQTADNLESTVNEWRNNPVWTNKTSPFAHLLPAYVNSLIGTTYYKVRWELLNGWNTNE